jgi:tRNA(Ile)-lysidine synthase
LLSYSKEELREYLLGKKVLWREDASNEKLLYRRNQIRHQIIPFLSKWNSDLSRKLAQMGEILASEDGWLENWVDGISLQLEEKRTLHKYSLSLKKFKKLSLPIQRRVIRRGAEILEPRARGLSFERLEEALEVWRLQRKGPRDLGFGLSIGVNKQELFIRKSGSLSP